MNINDYLIALPGKDWRGLLSDWTGALPSSFTLWLVNRFGNIFAVYDDQSVHLLDVGAGRLERLADNRTHFGSLIDQANNGNNWLMIPVVDTCVKAGKALGPSQCYGYKVPPLLGGKYELPNIEPTDLSVHYTLLAQLFRQTKGLPAGTKITSVVIK